MRFFFLVIFGKVKIMVIRIFSFKPDGFILPCSAILLFQMDARSGVVLLKD